MKSVLIILMMMIMILVPASLFARDFVELGIGFAGIYDVSSSDSLEHFFEGMVVGENWTVGLGLNARLSVLDLSFLVLPCMDSETDDGVTVLSGVGLSIPVITDIVYLKLGAGIRTEFTFPEQGEATVRVEGGFLPVSQASLSDVVLNSPVHIRFGLDFLFGPAILGILYFWESQATIGGFENPGSWATLLQPGEMDRLGIMFQLALF
jgi:hypothetical protein